MVWGTIHFEKKSSLVRVRGSITATGYCGNILRPVVIPFLESLPNPVFQQDNARPHTARQTACLLNENDVRMLPWPGRSPDISPIEHVWDMTGRRLLRNPVPARNTESFGRNSSGSHMPPNTYFDARPRR